MRICSIDFLLVISLSFRSMNPHAHDGKLEYLPLLRFLTDGRVICLNMPDTITAMGVVLSISLSLSFKTNSN